MTDDSDIEKPSATHMILVKVHQERFRQSAEEGFGPDHDDSEHAGGELLNAAVCYLIKGGNPTTVEQMRAIDHFWPWAGEWWKPKSRRRDIIRALALGVAELERMDRAEAKQQSEDLGRAEMDIDGGDE